MRCGGEESLQLSSVLVSLPQTYLETPKLTVFWTRAKYASRRVSENLGGKESGKRNGQSTRNSRIATATLIVRVTEVVDADPEREQGVVAGPGRARGLVRDGSKELVHLVRHGKDRWLIWLNKLRVDRRSTVREVVGQRQRLVELHGCNVNPVYSADSGPSLQMGA